MLECGDKGEVGDGILYSAVETKFRVILEVNDKLTGLGCVSAGLWTAIGSGGTAGLGAIGGLVTSGGL